MAQLTLSFTIPTPMSTFSWPILLTKGHKILVGRKNTDAAFNACNVEGK